MASWFQRLLGKASAVPAGQTDLFPDGSQEFYDDPYPFYDVLRRDHPFHRTPDGAWVISRFCDIKEALDHPSLGNRPSRFSTLNPSKSERFVCANLANNIMPFLDGIPHKEQRRLVARIFQREVKAFAPRLTELASQAVNDLPETFEVIEEFAHPFALQMICEILGIPVDPKLRTWSGSFFYLFTKIPTAEVREEVDHHLTQFRQWVSDCFQSEKRNGVLGALFELVSEGELDEAVAIDTIILLFADGLENVDSGIGNALLAFSRFPKQWEKFREDSSLVKQAVDEVLRFDSPAQYIARTCLEDFEWHGHLFKKDMSVILLLASGNRDEEAFPNAAEFDISRSPNSHLSFGHGKHSCLGSRLVEQELAAILTALCEKVSSIESKGPITWQKRTGHRWMNEGTFIIKMCADREVI